MQRVQCCGYAGRRPVARRFRAKWPEDRTVTIVINFPPGGTIDMVGRLVADGLARKYPKATFIVENRSGANGNIGQAYVGRAAPDGYTFLLTAPGPASYNALLYIQSRCLTIRSGTLKASRS